MYTRVFALASLLVSGAVAAENWSRVDPVTLRALRVRQGGESFKPGSNSGFGETCADAFGSGYEQCGSGIDCYNPTEGESCCKEGYPCPQGSFCLQQGYCCPEGLDPESCAKEHGITLTPTGSSGPTASATPIPPATVTPSSSSSPSPTPPSNSTVIPTGGSTPTGGSSPTSSPPPFTDAAHRQGVAMGAVVALGALGFFL